MGDYGTRTLRIANTSTPSECSTEGFSQTACGFVIEFADVITLHEMNDSSTNIGGWPASSMYTFVNTDIYNALPEELRDIIIDTVVVSSHGSEETTNFVSTDKLYLLAPTEIWSDWSNNCDTGMNTTRQLDYYKKQGVTTNNCSAAIKRSINDGNYWWLRAADFENNFSFFRVNTSGGWRYSYDSSSTDGVSPAFRIG